MTTFAFLRPARKLIARGAAALALLTLAACGDVAMPRLGGGGGGGSAPEGPVPVALLIPSSEASAAPVARSLENAARMAIADLGETQIDLRVYDTAGDPQRAASQAQAAVDAGARIILGPLFGEAANAAGVAVADDGVNVLAFSNNTAIAGGNVFVMGPTFENTARRLVSYAAAQGKRRAVVAHPDNVEGRTGLDALTRAAAGSPLAIAGSESFVFSQDGVVEAVPRIRSTVESTGADMLMLTSNTAGALPLLVQLLPESGVSPSEIQYAGLARWDVPSQTLELPGVQGGWFTMPDQGAMQTFESRYRAAYGSAPHQLAGLAFDGIAAIGALSRAGDALNVQNLTQSAGFSGVGGPFRLRRDGTNERGLAVATIRDNRVVILDPAPRSFGRAGF